MSHNYFRGTSSQPYHISIGAVVRNAEGKIGCHYFDTLKAKGIGTYNQLYLLMRETIEPHEFIEECLARGLQEEFGMKANLTSYIGSIVSRFKIFDSDTPMEKTTLYFLCEYVSMDESLREADEPTSNIRWIDPQELIDYMHNQKKRFNREDVDESIIVERVLNR